jgi:hypothetical protein
VLRHSMPCDDSQRVNLSKFDRVAPFLMDKYCSHFAVEISNTSNKRRQTVHASLNGSHFDFSLLFKLYITSVADHSRSWCCNQFVTDSWWSSSARLQWFVFDATSGWFYSHSSTLKWTQWNSSTTQRAAIAASRRTSASWSAFCSATR